VLDLIQLNVYFTSVDLADAYFLVPIHFDFQKYLKCQCCYIFWSFGIIDAKKYDKQDQQGKAAFNERNPHKTQEQEPVARSPGRPK
jgi:hypothetical protein